MQYTRSQTSIVRVVLVSSTGVSNTSLELIFPWREKLSSRVI